ncbi:unnamed protein product [Allacma fusca]|uniref:Prolyl 4-hydroxylase alpha subunit domain-containing protein n=1 Tax=Allacma fusca TaxID=39272 RepID=A0A8J2PAY2_9HEXA|nr:unnamed protein product [Allacma fusca]
MWHRKSTSIFGIITLVSMVLVLRARTTYSKETRHRYATLISDLEDLEHFEHKFAQNLTHSLIDSKLLSSRSKIRRFVHAYLVDFYQSSGYAKTEHVMGKETTGASNNPICAYRIIRRTTFLLKPLITRKDFLLKFGSLRRGLVKFFWSNGWPIFKDYEIAAEKLLTLQLVHNLEAEKMALGSISNVYSNCSLNSIHCYETGNIALRSKGFALALEWFELAKQKALIDKKASVAFIELLIWTATDGHNLEFREKKKNLGPNLYNRKIRYIPGDSKRAQKVRNIQYNKFKGKRHKSYDEFNYWGLCSGENFQTDEEKSFLFCWLEFKLHPGLTIGPLKMEFLARNPDIVQAYEILQDKQLETINSDARKIVDSSVLLRANSFRSTRFNNLTNAAVIAWSEGTEGHVLSEKVQQLSGLKDISPEMQIESYSFGGHYLPGNDTVHNDLSSTDADPIMSLIFHINTVGHGGYVAFPSLGVAAKPVKGAVISWYNQFPDGSPDLFTNHGSCPVLLGQKWVATKWISLKERFLEQKCGLNPNERFQFPVNNKYLGTPMVTKMDEEILPSPKFPHADTALLAKYSFVSPSGLRALVQFEWSLYPRIKYMYHKYRNQTKGTFREEYDRQNKDVSKYLEEFEKFTGRILGNLDSILNADNKTVEKVALSPLAAYKTTTRFMHYIQNWFRRKPSAKNKLMISKYCLLK